MENREIQRDRVRSGRVRERLVFTGVSLSEKEGVRLWRTTRLVSTTGGVGHRGPKVSRGDPVSRTPLRTTA